MNSFWGVENLVKRETRVGDQVLEGWCLGIGGILWKERGWVRVELVIRRGRCEVVGSSEGSLSRNGGDVR